MALLGSFFWADAIGAVRAAATHRPRIKLVKDLFIRDFSSFMD
jgi:hypothetical protein